MESGHGILIYCNTVLKSERWNKWNVFTVWSEVITAPDKAIKKRIKEMFFLFQHKNIRCGYSLEAP